MKGLLPKLIAALGAIKDDSKQIPIAPFTHVVPEEQSNIISHNWFWPRMGQFFRSKDIVVAETGTSSFGLIDVPVSTEVTGRALIDVDPASGWYNIP
jgi:pyruvate decarboxylase